MPDAYHTLTPFRNVNKQNKEVLRYHEVSILNYEFTMEYIDCLFTQL